MDIFFKGKGAVVIGAASGIGRAIAAALIEAGASVLLCDRNYRAVEVLARALGDRAVGRFTDVSDQSQVAAALAAARETFESLDIVVNCAGVGAIAAQTRLTGEKERSIQMVRRDEEQVA
jgi:NAD(P)-dependent dehydrogenase (short-subunit alcohol dehydrogenase family)